MPCVTGVHLEVQGGGGITMPIVTPFKINSAAYAFRRRGRNRVLHLTVVKPCYSSVLANFNLISTNVNIPASGFHFTTPDGYLDIINLQPITGCMTQNVANTPAIPVSFISMQDLNDPIISSLYQEMQPIGSPITGGGYILNTPPNPTDGQ